MKFARLGSPLFSTYVEPQKNIPLTFVAKSPDSAVQLAYFNNYGTETVWPEHLKLQYSFDRNQWNDWSKDDIIVLQNIDDKVYIQAKSTISAFSDGSNYSMFKLSGEIEAYGNIMSLLDNSLVQTEIPEFGFYTLFQECSALVRAPMCTASRINESGCYMMFLQTSIQNTMDMPNLEYVGPHGCELMYAQCESLEHANALYATNVQEYGYAGMFTECIALTDSIEVLPAQNGYVSMYEDMFNGCSALLSAPEIMLTSLDQYSCGGMFQDCKSLVKPPTALYTVSSDAQRVYSNMFYGCSSIADAPILCATTLTGSNSIASIYRDCLSLSSITVCFTTFSPSRTWVTGVPSTGGIMRFPQSLLSTLNSTPPKIGPINWIVQLLYADYKDYIKGNGGYVDTGYIPTLSTTIEFEIRPDAYTGSTYVGFDADDGKSTDSTDYRFFATTAGEVFFDIGSARQQLTIPTFTSNSWHRVKCSNGMLEVDGTQYPFTAATGSIAQDSIKIFGEAHPIDVAIKWLNIYENNQLCMNLSTMVSNDIAGFFDGMKCQFYSSANSAALCAFNL